MPTTYNGIGTHYYGKKNKKSRHAVCQQCRYKAQLISYETRLWFVVIFVPVIPLGRKRIMDQCSVCSWHYATPMALWETGRQVDTAEAMSQFRKEQSAETALIVHATLIRYQEFEQAETFRSRMLDQFSGQSILHAGLASDLDAAGLPKDATALWESAYKLDPDLPEARVGIASRRMQEKKLEEAHELLSFLEQPGAEQQYRLDPLFDLATGYQKSGKHVECLEVMETILKGYPDTANDHAVRKFITVSEKKLRREESILPVVKHSVGKLFSRQYSSGQRWAVGIMVAAILAVIGLVINNEYIRRHQPLIVINATGAAANIQIDGGTPVSVLGQQMIPVREGVKKIKITGSVQETHKITVESGYWNRWTTTPVWIVNVGGQGIIADVDIHYAVNPRAPTVRLHADPLFYKKHVDYPFEEPPESVDIGSRQSVTKNAISWVDVGTHAESAVNGYYTLYEYNRQKAWEYGKRLLTHVPSNVDLLKLMANTATDKQQLELAQLLESRIDHQPILIAWHRTYQDFPAVQQAYDLTVARYDAMLQKDPDNVRLLYLRGRFESNKIKSSSYFERARELDPKFPWPAYALAHHQMSDGHWDIAIDLINEALDNGIDESEIQHARHFAYLGSQRFEDLIQIHQATLKERSGSVQIAQLLAETLLHAGKKEEASDVLLQTISNYRREMGDRFPEVVYAGNAIEKYFNNDIVGALEEVAKTKELAVIRSMLEVESGKLDDAIEIFESPVDRDYHWMPVLCAIRYFVQDEPENTKLWYKNSGAHFATLGKKYEVYAQLMSSGDITHEMVSSYVDGPESAFSKSMLLTAMATQTSSPDIRQACVVGARRFLLLRRPPYGLLFQALEKLEQSK